MKKISTLLLAFLFAVAGIAQGPVHSPKLDKENGFNALIIGTKYHIVKELLSKDTITSVSSFDAKDFIEGFNKSIYLVDLAKPGYSDFLGHKIDRIEVWFSIDQTSEDLNAENVISDINIYFKADSSAGTNLFFLKLFEAYGGAYPVLDFPAPGDELITWYAENTMLTALNYYAGVKTPKRDYIKMHFYSSKGG